MCGICGVITTKKTTKTDINVFKSLLIANEARGEDSCGIYNGHEIIKKAVLPTTFIDQIDDNKLKSNILLGHTRYATTGKINDNNAHPFQYGNIIGIHNGIVNNHDNVGKYDVDSMAIFDLLYKNNNDYQKSFKKLEGSFALAWVNGDNHLYLCRNGNPLTIAHVNNSLFFSSEYYHLASILYAAYGTTKDIYTIKENTVYKINLNTLDTKIENVKFKKDNFKNYYNYKADSYYQDTPQYTDDTAYTRSQYDNDTFSDIMKLHGCSVCGKQTKTGYLDDYDYVAYCETCVLMMDEKDIDIEDMIFISD